MDIKFKYGIVCIIDFLGQRTFNKNDVNEFLEKRELIFKAIEKANDELNDMSEKFPDFSKYFKQPQIATFGDTFILCWVCTDNDIK